MMFTPELIISLSGFAVTLGTMIYMFGRLEGRVVTRLDEHERRLNAISKVTGMGI